MSAVYGLKITAIQLYYADIKNEEADVGFM
jgi:hypothetical protein